MRHKDRCYIAAWLLKQWGVWLGVVLIVVGVSAFRSAMPVGVVVVGIAAGSCLTITSMRLNNKR